MASELETIVDPYTGETRYLGSLPSDPRLVAALPTYVGEILPPSELMDFNDFSPDLLIKDQNGQGACNGFASAAVIEQSRFVQGMDHVLLSGSYVYSILCNGRDRGSNILQAYKLLIDQGVAPESQVPYLTLNPNKLTAEAHRDAANYKMEFGAAYQSWRQIVSAVYLRENMNLSVCVGRHFSNLDSEGVAGLDKGQGNHAVAVGLGLKFSKKWGWLVLMRNSWSTKWGNKGMCWLAEAHIEAGSYFECFSVRAVKDDPTGKKNPPVVILDNLPKRTTWKMASAA